MKLTKVVRREPLRQQVLASLKEALFNGRLAPGQQLTEEGVAEFLGVSRTPAREALAILFQEGILERRNTGGFTVTVPTKDKIEQIFQVRHLLEPYAARLAASHAKPKDIKRLAEHFGISEEKAEKRFTKTGFKEEGMDKPPRVLRHQEWTQECAATTTGTLKSRRPGP